LLAVVKVPPPIAYVKYKAQHVVLAVEVLCYTKANALRCVEISVSAVEDGKQAAGKRLLGCRNFAQIGGQSLQLLWHLARLLIGAAADKAQEWCSFCGGRWKRWKKRSKKKRHKLWD